MVVVAVLVSVGPLAGVLAVGVLMNPAAKGYCAANCLFRSLGASWLWLSEPVGCW